MLLVVSWAVQGIYPTGLFVATAVTKSYIERTIQFDSMKSPQIAGDLPLHSNHTDSSVGMSTQDTHKRSQPIKTVDPEITRDDIDVEHSAKQDANATHPRNQSSL